MKRFLSISLSLLLAVSAFADIHVKGKVIDADGSEPMIGVSVLVKGTTTGTVTDIDGNFSLTVPDKATLQLSYIGYKTIELRAVPSMQIIMETDATQLQIPRLFGCQACRIVLCSCNSKQRSTHRCYFQ